jgi:hypothetical protein
VCSQKTVRNHISNIFTKLQVLDRAPAIVKGGKPASAKRRREPRRSEAALVFAFVGIVSPPP